MRFFVSNPRARKKAGSHLALAIALATGYVVLTGVVAEPAYAQRDKKKDRKKDEKPSYSKEFIAAFTPLQAVVNDQASDLSAVPAQLPALVALSQSPDEKNATGGLVFNTGARNGDQKLQLQGVTLMLESGKVAPEQVGRFNFIAYQLSNQMGDYPKARHYLQRAIDTNFTSDNVGKPDMQIAMAESFITEGRFAEGLDYLSRAIDEARVEGRKVDETWYRRGLSVGYNNEIVPQVYDFVTGWVVDYPTAANWRDAINIARNLNAYEGPARLDLLRLSDRVDALKESYEFSDYVEAADARRLPSEVKRIIEKGYAAGIVSRDDIYLADSLEVANGRIAADRADLPALESDARAADAGLRTVMAAGGTFLSYGQYDKAEEFYSKALGMAGVDAAQALTGRGIAQVEQGKFDEAIASFSSVEGDRVPIARLWAAYARMKAAEASAAAPAYAPAPAAAEPTEG